MWSGLPPAALKIACSDGCEGVGAVCETKSAWYEACPWPAVVTGDLVSGTVTQVPGPALRGTGTLENMTVNGAGAGQAASPRH